MFLIGAMNVDVAILGVGVFFIQTSQPKNAGGNEIFLSSLRGDGSGCLPLAENFSEGCLASDFFVDVKPPQRGPKAPFRKAKPKFRSGNGIGSQNLAASTELHFLLRYGYYQTCGSVLCSGGGVFRHRKNRFLPARFVNFSDLGSRNLWYNG